jgi:hypothetical protein
MPELNLVFRATNHIKLTLEKVLREIFQTDLVPEEFRYDGDERNAKVRIFRGFPGREEFYPTIAITSGAFDGSLTAMGRYGDQAGEQYQTEGIVVPNKPLLLAETFTGAHTIPITLKVFCKDSSDEREKLTDVLYAILRIFSLKTLAPFGFAYNKIQINGENQSEYASRELIFTNSITIGCHTDYTYVMKIPESDLLEKIVIKVYGELNGDPKGFKFFEEQV